MRNTLANLRALLGLSPERGAIKIGRSNDLFKSSSWITEKQLNHHIHVVGASGFGKTVLISHIVKSRIENGHGLLFIDQKGDLETIQQFTKYALESGRINDLSVFSLSSHDKSSSYNLLNNGSAEVLPKNLAI